MQGIELGEFRFGGSPAGGELKAMVELLVC